MKIACPTWPDGDCGPIALLRLMGLAWHCPLVYTGELWTTLTSYDHKMSWLSSNHPRVISWLSCVLVWIYTRLQIKLDIERKLTMYRCQMILWLVIETSVEYILELHNATTFNCDYHFLASMSLRYCPIRTKDKFLVKTKGAFFG